MCRAPDPPPFGLGRQRGVRFRVRFDARHGGGTVPVMRLDEIGDLDGWRCWLCDEPVDPTMSVNDPRGPSVDSRTTERKAKAKGTGKGKGTGTGRERLAHRSCNTGKGAVDAVVSWPDDLFVADAAVIIPTVDRLSRKGGREVVGRCPDRADAGRAITWLVDRLSRLEPDLDVTGEIEPGGGQFLLVLRASS